jgi:hypothetical protein
MRRSAGPEFAKIDKLQQSIEPFSPEWNSLSRAKAYGFLALVRRQTRTWLIYLRRFKCLSYTTWKSLGIPLSQTP